MEHAELYRRWQTMWQRCVNPAATGYPNYGGRGITVCEEWKVFANFLRDVGEPPFPAAQLDRINNDKGYCKENVRWASPLTQAENRRTRRDNTSGVKGVSPWRRGQWRATATYKGEQFHLYCGPDFDEAVAARKRWEAKRKGG